MGQTDTQTGNNDSAAPATGPVRSPDVGQTYDRDLVYDTDGKLYREKFTGQKGRADELASKIEELSKKHESALKSLESEVKTREGKIAELTSKLENAGQELGQLKALEDRVPELEQQARQADRLRAVLEYPELVNRQIKEMVDEDEVLVNPILDLIESVNLEGDELRTHLRRLNAIVKAGEKPPTEPSPMEGASPAPGEPVEETPEYWETKARQAHLAANIAESDRERDTHLDDMQEYSRKAEEARAKLQS